MRRKYGASFKLALAAVLVVAQTSVLEHLLEHDPGSPQDQVCATCIVAQSASSACFDHAPACDVQPNGADFIVERPLAFGSVQILVARQRAPPQSL